MHARRHQLDASPSASRSVRFNEALADVQRSTALSQKRADYLKHRILEFGKSDGGSVGGSFRLPKINKSNTFIASANNNTANDTARLEADNRIMADRLLSLKKQLAEERKKYQKDQHIWSSGKKGAIRSATILPHPPAAPIPQTKLGRRLSYTGLSRESDRYYRAVETLVNAPSHLPSTNDILAQPQQHPQPKPPSASPPQTHRRLHSSGRRVKISAINEAKPHCGGSQEEIYQDHADVEAVWRVPSALGRDDMTSIVDDVAMMQNIVDNVPSKIPDSPLDALIDGLYNEQESAQSFQEALAAWRGTAVTVNTAATASEGSFTTEVAAAPKTTSQTLMDGAYDEQESARSFQEALAAWRGTTVPGATKKSATISAKTATTHEVMFDKQQPLSLKEGVYDEEESARSFQDALTPWRKGSAAVESKRNCGVSAAATNSFETPTTATASAPFNIVFNGGQSSTLSYLDRLMLEDLRRRKRDAEQVGQM